MSNLPIWVRIDRAVSWLNEQTGKSFAEDDLLELGRIGKLRIGAHVQDWKLYGDGELTWFRPNGEKANFVSDGMVALNQKMCEFLLMRPTVSLAMAKLEADTFDPDGNQIAGGEVLAPAADSPQIGREHLRIPRGSLEKLAVELPREIGKSERHKKGTKWTDEELHELMRAHQSGMDCVQLAALHGVTRQCISKLIDRAVGQFGARHEKDLTQNPLATLVHFKAKG